MMSAVLRELVAQYEAPDSASGAFYFLDNPSPLCHSAFHPLLGSHSLSIILDYASPV